MEPEPRDGRRARPVENRAKVARAMLDLIHERGRVPTADEVAGRAGLSRRTVFRLFEDLDGVRRAAIDIQRAEVMERFPPPMAADSIDAAIDALLAHRVAVYEHIMPVRRLAEQLKDRDAGIRESQASARVAFRTHLAVLLGAYLPPDREERERVLDALQIATSWNTWAQLRDDHGRGVKRAEAVVRRMVRALLD